MRSGASGVARLDASFAVSAMRARECRWYSALSIIAPSVNVLRRTPSLVRRLRESSASSCGKQNLAPWTLPAGAWHPTWDRWAFKDPRNIGNGARETREKDAKKLGGSHQGHEGHRGNIKV